MSLAQRKDIEGAHYFKKILVADPIRERCTHYRPQRFLDSLEEYRALVVDGEIQVQAPHPWLNISRSGLYINFRILLMSMEFAHGAVRKWSPRTCRSGPRWQAYYPPILSRSGPHCG